MSQRISETYVRVEFSARTKSEAWARCCGRCDGCGRDLTGIRYVYDHKTPLRRGGDASLGNCQVLCSDGPQSCDAQKTFREDIPGIAAIKRYGKNRLPLDIDRPAKKPGKIPQRKSAWPQGRKIQSKPFPAKRT